MKILFLFLFSTLLLSADFSLEELKGLTGADFLLPEYHQHLEGKELQKFLNRESSFSGLKRMTKEEWDSIPTDKSEISTFSDARSVDLSSNMPRVDNQGDKGSCAAWSGGYYMKSYYENKERGKSSRNIMSPAFIYNHRNGSTRSPCERDKGMTLNSVARIIKYKGIASWADMSYSGTKFVCPQPTSTQITKAWEYRIDSYKNVRGVNAFRTELAKGNPIYIGIAVSVYFSRASMGWARSSWGRSNPKAWKGGVLTSMPMGRTNIPCSATNPCSNNGGDGLTCVRGKCEETGAHGIVITGYDKDDDTFTIVNSWGTGWGTNGYLKIKTNVLEKMMNLYQGVKGIVYKDHVVAHCNNNCSADSYRCNNNNLERCLQNSSGCLDWKTTRSCGQNTCNASRRTCESSNNCQNSCSAGEKRCDPNDSKVQQTCVRNSAGCYVYTYNQRCSSCSNGTCTNGGGNDVCAGLSCSHVPNSECIDNGGRAACACKTGYKLNAAQDGCISDGTNCQSNCSSIGEETCKGTRILVCKDMGNNCFQYSTRNSCGQGWSCDTSNLNDGNSSNDCLKGDGGTGCENPNSLSDTNGSAGLLSILFLFSLLFLRRRKNI